eukprot:8206436-Pyramimonas_sp.AAC.1
MCRQHHNTRRRLCRIIDSAIESISYSVGLDTGAVDLTVKTLSSHLVALERIQFAHWFFTNVVYVCVEPEYSAIRRVCHRACDVDVKGCAVDVMGCAMDVEGCAVDVKGCDVDVKHLPEHSDKEAAGVVVVRQEAHAPLQLHPRLKY